MKLRILSAKDVEQALPMPQAIEVMRRAFGQLSAGQARMPLRSRLETEQGLMLLMPAYLSQSQELAVKTVTLWGDNPSRGLPAVMALATVFDPQTGQPVALLNGEALTAIRTGAGGGLAADLLARSDASHVTVFGAGVQARAQLKAVCVVRPIKTVSIVGRSAESLEKFAAEVRQWPYKLTVDTPVGNDIHEAVAQSNIIITATNSTTPVFDGKYLSAGTHITGVGSYSATMQEVDVVTVKRSKIVVDSLQACLAEAGDLVIPINNNQLRKVDLHGELGQIVNQEIPGRENSDEITFFKSVGVAVQDTSAATEAYKVANKLNLGQIIEL
ncbi:ornithine cyclodeaminase family protein [Anaerolineales bacterium HSG6]|nr:ornithine cyclodeaminase family protein [Anaerolineales bacterium HSG6]MDM8531758.1 ornithine cyclodeaminase family protein [Anaerolineales bacterium HSG25]